MDMQEKEIEELERRYGEEIGEIVKYGLDSGIRIYYIPEIPPEAPAPGYWIHIYYYGPAWKAEMSLERIKEAARRRGWRVSRDIYGRLFLIPPSP